MKLTFPLALLLHLASSNLATAALRGLRESVISDTGTRIVGGTEAGIGAYPFYAIPTGDYLCGASLVYEDILLSAAHCAGYFMGYTILLGGNNLSGDDARESILADTERIHPLYSSETLQYDFLLIKLSQPSSATPLQCNAVTAVPADGDTVKTLGFGQLGEFEEGSQVLMEVEVNVVDHDTCSSVSPFLIDEDSMICAGEGGKDSCYGDSGGPLLSMDGELIGVVSTGTGMCAEEGKPGVYSRVSVANDFIRQGICMLSANPPSDCPPAPSCNADDILVEVDLSTDMFPEETTWEIVRGSDANVVLQGDGFGDMESHICLPADECYTFTIYDSFGDGLEAPGQYSVSVDNKVVASGRYFASSESVTIGGACQADPAASASGIDLATCTPTESSNFNIQLINMGSSDIDPSLIEVFEMAAARWSKVIVGDVTPDFPAGTVSDWFSGQFSSPFDEAVDDLVIGFAITEIDGRGEVLGQAGPIFTRIDEAGNALAPISGIMIFDEFDVSAMPIDDFKVIVLHEMGHVLGLVGTITNQCNNECSPDSPEQSGYSCPLANAEYESLFPGESLKLENDGGEGTACSHWEEDSFALDGSSELMTGIFEEELLQPLSLVTVAALDDLGVYEVDYCGADVWPATADTQQKFRVFSASRTMDLDTMMMRYPPVGMMGADGKIFSMKAP